MKKVLILSVFCGGLKRWRILIKYSESMVYFIVRY